MVAIVAFAFVAVAVLIWVPKVQIASLKGQATAEVVFDRENEARRTLVQILGGSVILLSLYFAWKRIEVAQEGQITDRFSRAVEHLGSDKLDVRLGGIYALERIARDSAKDHWTVMEVLTAYVRERAPWPPREPREPQEEESSEPAEHKPPTDIQAALTVIGRRPRFTGETEDQRLDLRGTDLRGARLVRTNLRRADLWEANLTHAYLVGATLTRVNLWEANLTNTDLEGATLTEAFIARANLTGANLWAANLTDSDLGEANLTQANFWEANLATANLTLANLTGANVADANLTGAEVGLANLTDAILVGANLRGADLSDVKGLTQEQIDSAFTDQNTKLPDYLQKPAEPDTDTKEPNP